jgi:hypothetical protein
VSEWLKTYDEQGVDGLMEEQLTGRPSRLSEIQKIMLAKADDEKRQLWIKKTYPQIKKKPSEKGPA